VPQPIRVAFVASEYPPHIHGGLGTVVGNLSAALGARSALVDVFVPARRGYQSAPVGVRLRQVSVTGALNSAEYWLRFCERVVALCGRSGAVPDLVHCHDWMTALAGVALRRRLGVPMVLTVHLAQVSRLNLALENLGLVCADSVIVNSHGVAEEIAARGLPLTRSVVVPNGVDLECFCSLPGSQTGRMILFVGRLVQQKGVDVLLRAFAAVLRKCPEVRLVIAGDGYQRLYLERLSRHLGLPPSVEFVGWQTGPALTRLYQNAGIVVVPSIYEPFGLVALEAMACGRPVVASRTGGLAEVVTDGNIGYLVPPADHLSLAQRMAQLLLEPARAAAMGQAARQEALRYSWEHIAELTRGLYHDTLDRHDRDAPAAGHLLKVLIDMMPALPGARTARLAGDWQAARDPALPAPGSSTKWSDLNGS
jgi:glycosyltransferase involved in cell wall biosynthesis